MAILEIGEDGVLRVPGELLAGAQPHAQFELALVGQIAVLRPADATQAFWQQATPSERAEAFAQWVNTAPPDAPDIPSESLRREKLYD